MLQILSIVGELREFVRFDVIQGRRQPHLPEAVVVPVSFSIGGNTHQFGPRAQVLGETWP